MSLYFRLNKDLNTQQLLKKLQHEINDYRKSGNLEDSILCIEIKRISHTSNETILKLERTLEELND